MAGGSFAVVLVVVILAVSLQPGASKDGIFEVFRGEWETCKRINSSAACYRTREVFCRTVVEKKPAPWRYCSETEEASKPASEEECKCQQDCVVTKWSAWSPCSNGETYTTRRRAVAAPALRGGKPCPALHGRKRCEANAATIGQLQRNHTWRVGQWQECVPIGQQDSRHCGHGIRKRSVQCLDTRKRVVNETFCLAEEAYRHVLPPQVAQLCEVPCPCRLSVWGEWSDPYSDCTQPNPRRIRHRSRTILLHPTLGEHCEELEEFEVVSGEVQCPYHWETSGWSDCAVIDEVAECGVGLHQRYVYCINESVGEHVSKEMCNSSQMPSTLGSCEVSCSQDCIVSQWTEWSQCRNDTCEKTHSQRNRTTLVQSLGRQGTRCPHLTEFRECPQIPCARWAYSAWSTCFPSNHSSCGWGLHSRDITCRDYNGNDLGNPPCQHLPHEYEYALCYKHCLYDECVISDWSEWSDCSETCGDIMGTQTRTRYLVVNSTNCEHHEGEFFEEHSCSVSTPCEMKVFHIEHGPWGECQVSAGATSEGETCDGVQNRTAHFFQDGRRVNQSGDCQILFAPYEEQSCSVSCSDQCLMSEWSSFSKCSDSCRRTRTRRLLRFGDGCPHLDSNGIETETEECECPGDYHWVTDSWGPCYIFPNPLSQLSSSVVNSDRHCGQGYENRSVLCQDSTGNEAKEGLCSAENKPPAFQACITQCNGHCIISDWSEYGTNCSGSNQIKRTRQIIPFRGSDDYFNNCPGLESVAVVDAETCPAHNFTRDFRWTITWYMGELHDCYLDPDKTCGKGVQTRISHCISNSAPHVAVNPDFCVMPKPSPEERMCTEACNIDCGYSDSGWSVWSECSASCGVGARTRSRTIERVPQDGGRLCGHLNETSICEMPACDVGEYSYAPQGICQPSNQTSGCGEGNAVSSLVCLVNGVPESNVSICSSQLGPRQERMLDCAVPCPGECVLSEWSAWRWCPECHSGCYTRNRRILRQGTDGCGDVELHQWEQCASNSRFAWSADEWTDCIVEYTPRSGRDYCGSGVQRRAVQCMRSEAVTYYDGKCSHLPKPASARGCSVPCPVDCVVGTFEEWSGCDRCTSDLKAKMTRERRILVQPADGGRGCPHLVEEQACPNIGCDEYFVETNSSSLDCSSEHTDQVCGRVSHTVLLCRKNRHYVPVEECMRASHTGLIVHNSHLLNHHEVYCDVQCPNAPECEFTDFGSWSECLHMCDWPVDSRNISSLFSFQFRSRTLLSWWQGSRDRCHGLQQEVHFCTPNSTSNATLRQGSKCIQFNWKTSEWYTNNTRDVQCHGNNSQVEEFACVKSQEPVSQRNADEEGICNCPFLSECDGETTECVCLSASERAGGLCLPVQGCLESPMLDGAQQCLPREVCGEDEKCVCLEKDDCRPTPSAVPSSATVEVTTVNPTSEPAEPEETSANVSDILLIVLITCVPLLVFVVILLVIIIITCKCRQHLDKKHRRRKPPPTILHQNQQLNNQSDALQHNLKDGGVRIQEVTPETTSHVPLHVHNGSASSGFVDELEHDILKYGQTSFNGYSQTQSEIDEAGFATDGNPYAPYPLPDTPSVTPLTPHPPYVPYEIEGNGSVPYHSHHGNGMRPVDHRQPDIPPHVIPHSISEEARLARTSGGQYHQLVEEQEYPHVFTEHSGEYGGNYYPPSPGSQRAHPHTSHHHHSHGNSGRDNRIMIGLDSSMVRAIEEMTASEVGSRSPSVSSMGSRSSARRSRRRHHRGHHAGSNGHREPRIHSPVGGPSHSAQGYYHDVGEEYLSNTLPRSVSSKHSSPNMPHRVPRHPTTTEASPLVNNVASPRYVRSASNEILETRRRPGVPSPLDMSHDQRGTPGQALPDEYVTVYHATNPLTISPPGTSSHISEDGDYDHITPSPAPPPPPPPRGNLDPPVAAALTASLPSTSPINPPSSTESQFPQELFQAIKKRANSNDTSPGVARTASNSAQPSPPSAVAPPPKSVSSRRGRSHQGGATNSRFTAAMLSVYDKGNPPTPPVRGSSFRQGHNDSLASNQEGAAPPPPPPPPVRS